MSVGYNNVDRTFWLLEGFGYSSQAELRAVLPSYSGDTNIDTTTVPGRRCLSIPPGGWHDIHFPRSIEPWTANVYPYVVTVLQAKIYLNSASYTNLLTNPGWLAEIVTGTSTSADVYAAYGLSPNTSVDQDNWYMKTPARPTNEDYAINNPAYVPPAIPPQTLTDVKFIMYSDGVRDGTMLICINNFLVAYSGFGDNTYEILQASGRRLGKIRLHGLANQSGPTLWSDVMVYTLYPPIGVTSDLLTNSMNWLPPRNSAVTGDEFVPISARVLDITPDTTDGGINEFSVLGTGNPITALSNYDTNQYVTSTAPDQEFRLKINEPAEATGDNSTAITVTDQSEVLATQYRLAARDRSGLASPFYIAMSDESGLTYQYRYYRLRVGVHSDRNDQYMYRVHFVNTSLLRLEIPSGATMRLEGINGNQYPATEIAVDRTVNTVVHTPVLTAGGGNAPFEYYQRLFTGQSTTYNRAWWADYLIDMGVGNVGPDWYALYINQTGDTRRNFYNWNFYGSSDLITWYSLAETHNGASAFYLYNRRHPSYPGNGKIRNLVNNFSLNAAQYEQLAYCRTGDPFVDGKTPSSWAQFKNYKIGFGEAPS